MFLFDTDLRYVRAHGAELEEVGTSPDEIEGGTPHDVFPRDIADELAQYYTDTLEGDSHDLRNPLAVADSRLELAQESCESPPLVQAADAIERSQALIEDVLTLAREGEDVSEVEPIELADVAESSWQTVEASQQRSKPTRHNPFRPTRADSSNCSRISTGTLWSTAVTT